jgi:hypothetical protein
VGDGTRRSAEPSSSWKTRGRHSAPAHQPAPLPRRLHPRGRCHSARSSSDAPYRMPTPASGSAGAADAPPAAYVRPTYVAADLLRRVLRWTFWHARTAAGGCACWRRSRIGRSSRRSWRTSGCPSICRSPRRPHARVALLTPAGGRSPTQPGGEHMTHLDRFAEGRIRVFRQQLQLMRTIGSDRAQSAALVYLQLPSRLLRLRSAVSTVDLVHSVAFSVAGLRR